MRSRRARRSPGLFGGYPRIDALFLSGGSLYGLEVDRSADLFVGLRVRLVL